MHIVGILGRAYYNIDNQKIIQTNDAIRKVFTRYENVITITLLPTENINYQDIEMGLDNVSNKLDYILDKCDAFIIPGGSSFYNFDNYVISYAIKNDKPLLAICLGFQALCSLNAFKKTNFQMNEKLDLKNHLGSEKEYKHEITINKNSKLYNILKCEKIWVNSLHHYVVNYKLKNLKMVAFSNDNILEAVEYQNKKFIIGIEWHPEYLMDLNSLKIFDAFIEAIEY